MYISHVLNRITWIMQVTMDRSGCPDTAHLSNVFVRCFLSSVFFISRRSCDATLNNSRDTNGRDAYHARCIHPCIVLLLTDSSSLSTHNVFSPLKRGRVGPRALRHVKHMYLTILAPVLVLDRLAVV